MCILQVSYLWTLVNKFLTAFFSGLSSKVWFEAVSAKSASIKEWLTADNSSTNKRACETNESFDGNQMKDLDSNLHGNSNRVV